MIAATESPAYEPFQVGRFTVNPWIEGDCRARAVIYVTLGVDRSTKVFLDDPNYLNLLIEKLGASTDEAAKLDRELGARIAAGQIAIDDGHAPGGAPGGHRAPVGITAAQLQDKVFPDSRWAIPGILPEGVTILAGAPKLGKSWLALGIGLAIARGGLALGKVPVEQGEVLYLALEDTERRLQNRIETMIGADDWPAGLHLYTEWPRIDDGGLDLLYGWLSRHPSARLVIVDVLARIRPASATTSRATLYEADYGALVGLKSVADQCGVSDLVVHHSRKAPAEDPLSQVSGSFGLTGAADTVAILSRDVGRSDATLYIRGRDVAESDLALGFDAESCSWSVLGDAAAFRLSSSRAEILEIVKREGAIRPQSIADALGVKSVRMTLSRMVKDGQVIATNGFYSVPAATGTGAVTPVTPVTLPEESAPISQNQATRTVTPHIQVLHGGVTGTATVTPVDGVLHLPVTADEANYPRDGAEFFDAVTGVTGVTPILLHRGTAGDDRWTNR